MRSLLIFFLITLISACSTTPRVGDVSDADYPIKISAKSSQALKQLEKVGMVGVRDLTAEEFLELKDDYEQFIALNGEDRSTSNSTTYALSSTAVGTGLGLSLGYAGGLALLGKLAADERPVNYGFADDYKSETLIYSPLGSDELLKLLVKKMPVAMGRFEEKMNSAFTIKKPKKPYHALSSANDKGNRIKKDLYSYVGITSAPKGSVKGSRLTQYILSVACDKAVVNAICEVSSKVKVGTSERPFVSLMIKELASSLPENSLIYMSPRRDIYQLPSVYKAGGEHLFLVED